MHDVLTTFWKGNNQYFPSTVLAPFWPGPARSEERSLYQREDRCRMRMVWSFSPLNRVLNWFLDVIYLTINFECSRHVKSPSGIEIVWNLSGVRKILKEKRGRSVRMDGWSAAHIVFSFPANRCQFDISIDIEMRNGRKWTIMSECRDESVVNEHLHQHL